MNADLFQGLTVLLLGFLLFFVMQDIILHISRTKDAVRLQADAGLSRTLWAACSGRRTSWDEFKEKYDIHRIRGALQNLWEEQIEPKLEEEAQNARDTLEYLIK